jgi:DNA-directed RNA polymerase subunit F
MEELKKELQEVIAMYNKVSNQIKEDDKFAIIFERILITVNEKIQNLREEITAIEKVSDYLPPNYLYKKEVLVLPPPDTSSNALDCVLAIMKARINEMSNTLVDNGPQITKEALKIIIRRKFSNIQNDTINSIQDAVVHYYTGNGRPALLGLDTVDSIKQSDNVQQYKAKIEEGLIANPASGAGIPIEIQADDTSLAAYLGQMTLRYETTCDEESCTTVYIVDGNGFVGLNDLNEDLNDEGGSPNDKLEGIPYPHEGAAWKEDFPNPGYSVKDARPLPIEK